jgi:rubrerythrin
MFTEADLLSYFDQIQKIETKMYETYHYLHDQLSHPEYKKIFGQLARDEKAHDMLIQDLKDLLVG